MSNWLEALLIISLHVRPARHRRGQAGLVPADEHKGEFKKKSAQSARPVGVEFAVRLTFSDAYRKYCCVIGSITDSGTRF